MQLISEQLTDGILEREFTLDDIPGIVWTPEPATSSTPAPVILMGHPGGLRAMHPRLNARARRSAALGFATASIEPGWPHRYPGARRGGCRPLLPSAPSLAMSAPPRESLIISPKGRPLLAARAR